MMEVESRPGSALSMTSNMGSKIPRLTRSASLREKNTRLNRERSFTGVKPASSCIQQSPKTCTNVFNLSRSLSFATSRGMSELRGSNRASGSQQADSPPRRIGPFVNSSYISPYSKSFIDTERKNQSYGGIRNSRDREVNSYYSPQISRRKISLPLTLAHTTALPHDNDDDNVSEKSFDSVSSTRSYDINTGMRKLGIMGSGGTWRHRAPNTVHCSHGHGQDPDSYLTPTQRMARKIIELQGQLKKARREIYEKDSRISNLTRELVEFRMTNSTTEITNDKNILERDIRNGSCEATKKDSVSNPCSVQETYESGVYLPHCLTPTSDDSERELRVLSAKEKAGSPMITSVGGSSELSRSLADSGNCDDLPSCVSSKESAESHRINGPKFPTTGRRNENIDLKGDLEVDPEEELEGDLIWDAIGAAEESVRDEWSRRVEEQKGNHMEEYNELKEKHNDKVEMLLSKLSEANLKYFEIRPKYDKAIENVRELEKEKDRLLSDLQESELRHQKIYLQMYLKGHQAAKFEIEEDSVAELSAECGAALAKRNSITELQEKPELYLNNVIMGLMKQLSQTELEMQRIKVSYVHDSNSRKVPFGREEIDPEITLQFLKSAIYYFLTDKDNADGHLKAIESILGYTTAEKGNIDRNFRG